jgi:TRAP-type mannitol/chloroaromatic compound transport system permease small subunit
MSDMQNDTFVDRLSKGGGAVAAMMILPAIFIAAYEVFARYVLNQPTNWVFPTTIALCAISYVLSGPYLLQRNEFIRVTFIYDKLGPRYQRVVDLISAVMELLWAGVLTVASWMQAYPAIYRFRGGEWRPETLPGAWNVPIPALVRGVLFIGCLLLLLQAIVSLARRLRASGPAEMKGDSYVD